MHLVQPGQKLDLFLFPERLLMFVFIANPMTCIMEYASRVIAFQNAMFTEKRYSILKSRPHGAVVRAAAKYLMILASLVRIPPGIPQWDVGTSLSDETVFNRSPVLQ
jgi:hypothetical protein